jgi:membrane-bound metal-dependent hydrolase YbcI (DUF457 family)
MGASPWQIIVCQYTAIEGYVESRAATTGQYGVKAAPAGKMPAARKPSRMMPMASYRGHLMFSSLLGAGYGAAGLWRGQFDWGPACLAVGVTTVGGLLPDLDSDSGVPVRELFGLAAFLAPLLMYSRLAQEKLTHEQTIVALAGVYLFVRYFLSSVFKHWTVHRGMFHSLPALLISGLILYLVYPNPDVVLRVYLAGGVMIGFLSHLVLDELYSVDFMGVGIRLNKYAGSALKLASPSRAATLTTYVLLAGLAYVAWNNYQAGAPPGWHLKGWAAR